MITSPKVFPEGNAIFDRLLPLIVWIASLIAWLYPATYWSPLDSRASTLSLMS